jgi:hypothetical protein
MVQVLVISNTGLSNDTNIHTSLLLLIAGSWRISLLVGRTKTLLLVIWIEYTEFWSQDILLGHLQNSKAKRLFNICAAIYLIFLF